MSVSSYAILWAGLVAVLLTLTRRRWTSVSCVGAYVVSYLVMDYVGLVFLGCGYEFETRETPYVPEESLKLAILIASLGITFFLVGIRLTETLFGAPRIYSNHCILPVAADSPLGMRKRLVGGLALIYALIFLFLARHDLPAIFRFVLSADAYGLYQYRLDTVSQNLTLLVTVTYNLLPFAALCGIIIFWRQRSLSTWVFVPTFFLACLGKVILVHKEPLTVFVIQCCIVWFLLRANQGQNDDDVKFHRASTLVRGAAAVFVTFAIMTLLMWKTHELDYFVASPIEEIKMSAKLVLERVFGRVSNGYIYIADMVPDRYPHYGFHNSLMWARAMGGEFVPINKEIFLDTHSNMWAGSISSDSLINYYGGFGMWGLIGFSTLQGMFLAGIDLWISRRPATLGWLVVLVFMMSFCFYLTETTLFGALMGFGGISFFIHAILINPLHPQQEEPFVLDSIGDDSPWARAA